MLFRLDSDNKSDEKNVEIQFNVTLEASDNPQVTKQCYG